MKFIEKQTDKAKTLQHTVQTSLTFFLQSCSVPTAAEYFIRINHESFKFPPQCDRHWSAALYHQLSLLIVSSSSKGNTNVKDQCLLFELKCTSLIEPVLHGEIIVFHMNQTGYYKTLLIMDSPRLNSAFNLGPFFKSLVWQCHVHSSCLLVRFTWRCIKLSHSHAFILSCSFLTCFIFFQFLLLMRHIVNNYRTESQNVSHVPIGFFFHFYSLSSRLMVLLRTISDLKCAVSSLSDLSWQCSLMPNRKKRYIYGWSEAQTGVDPEAWQVPRLAPGWPPQVPTTK